MNPARRAIVKMKQTYDKWFPNYRPGQRVKRPVVVVPYRGWGNDSRIVIGGRVLFDRGVREAQDGMTVWQNAKNMLKRYASLEIPDADLTVHFEGKSTNICTNDEGYFDVEMFCDDLGGEQLWHDVHVDLHDPVHREQESTAFRGEVQIPTPRTRFGVISDVDDTIVRTGATNLFEHTKVVLFNNELTRMPFPGVGAFYRALQTDASGRETNPFWYVSSSPWNLYDLFTNFMQFRGIPRGCLHLKDYGFDETKFIKTSHESHKIEMIERLLASYPDMPFILLGDSGQKDPEIYHSIAREYPDRILAVYIREVTGGSRSAEIEELSTTDGAESVPVVLAEDTLAAACHAADCGWIDGEDVDAITEDIERSQGLLN